jgi:hypothetical protein
VLLKWVPQPKMSNQNFWMTDCRNQETGIEDKLLKDDLYRRIVDSLFNRIELSRNMSKFIAADPV